MSLRAFLFGLACSAFALQACDNVLPDSLEERIRTNLAASRERDAMLKQLAVFGTAKGEFTIRFFGEDVPKSVLHVRSLIHEGFYEGLRIHRAVKSPIPFLVQLGDELTRGNPGTDFVWTAAATDKPVAGSGLPPRFVDFEASPHKHVRGAVALARRGDEKRAGSQFYIMLSDQPQLDDGYTVIGEIVAGMDVVDSLELGDRIEKVRLVEKPEG